MNRTRIVFFAIVALCLAIVALSLATQLLSETNLLAIYVGASVFSVGVVLLDFFGILGHHGDAAGHDAGVFADHDIGGHDAGGDDFGGHDAGGEAGGDGMDHAGMDDGHADQLEHDGQAEAGHDQAAHANQSSAAPILSVLAYLRLLVYFCLGFGPAGWAALVSGWSAWRSLVVAVPVGLLSDILARAVFRFQRRDTGTLPPSSDLLRARATVIVPLDARNMGKVRVQAGMSVSDLYALAADAGCEYGWGDAVSIVRVTDDCVYVR